MAGFFRALIIVVLALAVVGGAGSDTLIGGAGSDTADYSASAAAVNVNLLQGAGSGGDPATLNQPSLANTQCYPSCTFVRRFRNTQTTSSTWNTIVLVRCPSLHFQAGR